MKLGILGGTFDPVHKAHLAMAHAAAEQLALDEVLFVPTGKTHYRTPARAEPRHRLAMLRLALAGNPRFRIDERELSPQASGYTVDTLKALACERPGDKLYLLIGADQLAAFGAWRDPEEVKRLAQLAVVERPGTRADIAGVRVVTMAPLAISASEIRGRAARGEELSDAVPPSVAAYIRQHGLYR